MKADKQTTTDVINALVHGHDAYARRDIDGLLAAFVPDADVTMIGTGVDEKRIGLAAIRAQAERDWSQTDASSVRFENYEVSASGPVAWVSSDATFHVESGEGKMDVPARMTAVFEKRGNRWLLAQAHYSLPWAEQADGESFPN